MTEFLGRGACNPETGGLFTNNGGKTPERHAGAGRRKTESREVPTARQPRAPRAVIQRLRRRKGLLFAAGSSTPSPSPLPPVLLTQRRLRQRRPRDPKRLPRCSFTPLLPFYLPQRPVWSSGRRPRRRPSVVPDAAASYEVELQKAVLEVVVLLEMERHDLQAGAELHGGEVGIRLPNVVVARPRKHDHAGLVDAVLGTHRIHRGVPVVELVDRQQAIVRALLLTRPIRADRVYPVSAGQS